ncbi:MAG: phosphopantetheine-binding protein [Myxococcaceae bacterium]
MSDDTTAWVEQRNQVLARVRRVLIEELKVARSPDDIDPDAPLFGTGLGLDSVDAVELVVSLETEFAFRVEDDGRARASMRTVNTLVDLVLRKQGKARPPGITAGSRAPAPIDAEIETLRTGVALVTTSEASVLSVAGAGAFATLDFVCTTSLALQDTQLRPTLLLDDEGHPLADAVLARDDQRFLLFAEGISPDALEQHVRRHAKGDLELTRLDATHRVLQVHGPWSWDFLASVLGPDVIGLPYLTFLRGTCAGRAVTCLRTGKTGEFGYELLVANADADAVLAAMREKGRDFGVREVSRAALDHCALENGFFNVRVAAAKRLTPGELGLRWRVSPRKKDFVGASGASRALTRRQVTLVSASPLEAGQPVQHAGQQVGEVLQGAWSPITRCFVGQAVLSLPVAMPGVPGLQVGGASVAAVSPPVVNNRSLFISPQQHAWAGRQAVNFGALTVWE